MHFIVNHLDALLSKRCQRIAKARNAVRDTRVMLDVCVAVEIVRGLVSVVALHHIVQEVLDQLTILLSLIKIRQLHRAVDLRVARGIGLSQEQPRLSQCSAILPSSSKRKMSKATCSPAPAKL